MNRDNKKQLLKFLDSIDFGEQIAADYYGGVNEYYKTDLAKVVKSKGEAHRILSACKAITDDQLTEACKNAFSGRLEWTGEGFNYTAGQFWNIEAPQAVEAVAEYIYKLQNNK